MSALAALRLVPGGNGREPAVLALAREEAACVLVNAEMAPAVPKGVGYTAPLTLDAAAQKEERKARTVEGGAFWGTIYDLRDPTLAKPPDGPFAHLSDSASARAWAGLCALESAEQRDLLRYYEVEQLRLTRAHHSLAQKLRVS